MKSIQPKIIIVNNCNDCPYAQYGGLGVICHKLEEIGKYNVPYDMDDCPLKPMPQKKDYFDGYHEEAKMLQMDGWNACIDYILGETE